MTPTNRPGRPSRRGGFTLIELLVAVGILVIMLLAFGQIVAQSQVLVEGCQQIMRMNTTASVVAQLLQRDLLSVSKDGFLTVGASSLTFTRVAPHTSILDTTVSANAAVVNYGRQGSSTDGILGRQAILLVGDSGGTLPADAKAVSLSSTGDGSFVLPPLALPPSTSTPMGASAKNFYAYLAGGCTKFDVYCWTRGGADWAPNGSFNSKDLTTWPLGIRVVFSLKDGASKQDYEFMTDLP